MIDETRKPRAYSYLRFSTPEQRHGDSFRRQTDLASRYAAENGLELDDTLRLQDEGISAFRGKNAALGKLAEFLEHVDSGEVPQGSYLLVENLDRITRQNINEAQYFLSGILRRGVVVVTLMDGRKFEWGKMDTVDFLISLITLSRGHEESATKSKRLKAAWEEKRAQAATKPLTSKCPAWLRFDPEAGKFEPILERAQLVQRIFEATAEGAGQHKIAAMFNGEGIRPWGRAKHWQRSYIAKILRSPAVQGTLIPHAVEHDETGRRRIPLEPVHGYYPVVVAPELYAEVQSLQDVIGAQRRGVSAISPISSILAGMAACPNCGQTMTRVQKGRKSLPSLVCTRAKAGAGCKYHSVPYAWIEDALLRGLPDRLTYKEGQEATEAFAAQARSIEFELERLVGIIDNLTDNLAEQNSAALRRKLVATEREHDAKKAELHLVHERRAVASGLSLATRAEKAIAAMRPEGRAIDRGEINRALKGLFRRAVINWNEGQIELEWTHGGICEVPYVLASSA